MQPILKAVSLHKKYDRTVALDNLSLEVYPGEIFGFLGPNGAGKTTAIKIMSGLLKPDSGSVEILCRNSAESIGLCPQHLVIWENLTCFEQVSFMGRMYGLSSRESSNRGYGLLEVLGLIDKKDSLAKTLSGGMQRRLNIALALVHSPAIVFLDEPQAGLDPQSRLLVRDYIKSIKDKTTVILSTHDMEEAEKLSDRICIIDRGRVLAEGATHEITKFSGLDDLIEIDIVGDINNELIPYISPGLDLQSLRSASSASFKIIDPLPALGLLLDAVKSRGIKVNDLRFRKTSLEDVFISMTGRSLRE